MPKSVNPFLPNDEFADLPEIQPTQECQSKVGIDCANPTESPVNKPFVLPNMTFALYQMRWEDSLHELRFLPMDYLQTQALAFRGKVHTATEDMDGHLFDDKPQAETWFREQGFEIRENPDPTEITVSDDMLHESVIYLTYGENCCRVDGCDTRALDRLVDRSNYELVYEGPVPQECAGMTDTELILNSIYYQMNMQHPDGYRGASMSMSDVVALTQDGKTTCYYTDRIGFRQLDDFLTKENPLRNAEMALEDDYGMIDGIINNGPRQEEPRTSVRDTLKECRSKASKAEHPHPERTTHKENER